MKSVLTVLALVLPLLGAAPPVPAQTYPSGPITLVIPLAPGDATDVAGRAMAEELAKLLKVPCSPSVSSARTASAPTSGTGS